MKNNKLYALFGVACVLTLGACSDDDIIKGSHAGTGQEVNFGAQLDRSKSRTTYGEETNGAFPIYWNTEDQGFDKIFISAPNALKGRNQAFFSVRPVEDKTAPAAVVKIGESGIQWGDQATKFYGFYPGNENFNLSAADNTVTATLPGNQTITFDYKLDPNETSGHVYKTNPDMSCVMMVAQTGDIEPTDRAIGLQFEPLSTVIDVTVSGPTSDNVTNPYHVTSVSVISDNAAICGKFTYDYDTKTVTPDPAPGDSMITVRTMGLDSQGNYVGVPLRTGQKLNVKISMLPYTDVEKINLKVQVTTADSKIWTKALETANLAAGQINPVTLPQLVASAAKLDYSRWISQLDPRIYISEVSLPGSALAFNINGYMATGNENQCTQFGSIDQQFAAGIRAFQGHIWMGGDGQLVFTTSNGNNTGITLRRVCSRLQEEMEKSHSHGFCVLLLSDYEIAGSGYTLNDVYDRLQDVTAELQQQNILAPDITPQTTIADVRGKIILKLQLNASVIATGNDLQTHPKRTNTALKDLQTRWQNLAISGSEQTKALFNIWTPAAGSNVFYSPMTFGTIGTYTFTDASRDWLYNYTPAVITPITPGIAVESAIYWARVAGAREIGNLNITSTNDIDMSDANKMWYIYNEQANAGKNISQCETNITNMVKAIPATYTGKLYNKFYMTWVGGAGSSYGRSVKNQLNEHWLTQTNTASKVGENYPLGWVLFNDVTDHFNDTIAGDKLTQKCIERVINQNTKEGFILERDRTQTITPAVAPTGDVKGTKPAGPIF